VAERIGESVVARLLIGLAFSALLFAACSSQASRPGEFEGMNSDEVGCEVVYGDSDPYIIGPLGASDSEEIRPNDYTLFRIARTASDIIVVVEQPDSAANASVPLNDLPDDGTVARGPFRNGANPGYVVTCWRGDG
jgi:hypothetical protein